jgi:2-polyprenyl-3-methyl-5-hydroxy-6-metoxy-1,4-benzoquinol methylase
LSEDELADLYNSSKDLDIARIPSSRKGTGHDTQKIKKFKLAIQLLKMNKKDIENVFDLGCSTGIFLEYAAKEGWVPFGSDVNRILVEKNKEKYGNQIKLQVEGNIEFPDRYFDVVTLFDSIEHMPYPIDTLQEVSRVLKDDGLVVITTPNIDGLFPRLTYSLLYRTVGAWEHPTPPGHVFQFSTKTLNKILERAGLKLIDSKNFEIHMPYTVGELENSIIYALRNNCHHHHTKNTDLDLWSSETKECNNNYMLLNLYYSLKKLPRALIRGLCWSMVGLIYPIARVLKKGDSMVVVARKKLR